jgi:hypothetical protein
LPASWGDWRAATPAEGSACSVACDAMLAFGCWLLSWRGCRRDAGIQYSSGVQRLGSYSVVTGCCDQTGTHERALQRSCSCWILQPQSATAARLPTMPRSPVWPPAALLLSSAVSRGSAPLLSCVRTNSCMHTGARRPPPSTPDPAVCALDLLPRLTTRRDDERRAPLHPLLFNLYPRSAALRPRLGLCAVHARHGLRRPPHATLPPAR